MEKEIKYPIANIYVGKIDFGGDKKNLGYAFPATFVQTIEGLYHVICNYGVYSLEKIDLMGQNYSRHDTRYATNIEPIVFYIDTEDIPPAMTLDEIYEFKTDLEVVQTKQKVLAKKAV